MAKCTEGEERNYVQVERRDTLERIKLDEAWQL